MYVTHNSILLSIRIIEQKNHKIGIAGEWRGGERSEKCVLAVINPLLKILITEFSDSKVALSPRVDAFPNQKALNLQRRSFLALESRSPHFSK